MKKLADVLFGFLFEPKYKSNKSANSANCERDCFRDERIIKESERKTSNASKTDNHVFNRESAIENSFRKFYRNKAIGKFADAELGFLDDRNEENFNENVVKRYFKGFVGLSVNADCRYDKT